MSTANFPSYALAYTSARPAAIAGVLDLWFRAARNPERVTAVVCVDTPDIDAARETLRTSPWEARTTLVENGGPRTCVAGWNEAARHTRGDVIVGVSDDFLVAPAWDTEIAAAGPDGWWREDRIVAVADGNVQDLFTLPILTRRRYERFGYLFHPAYASLFADTEFTAVACGERAVIDARHLLFEHRHHFIGKRAKDDVDREHSSQQRWDDGEQLYLARQRAGFPAEPRTGLPPDQPLPAVLRFAVYVQANRDDLALRDIVDALLRQSRPGEAEIGGVFLFCPDEYWSGRKTPAEDVAQVEAAAAALRQDWPQLEIQVQVQPVAPFRIAAGTRLEVETRARNAALADIRGRGYDHILVMDGDELWRPGFLAYVTREIRTGRAPALRSPMVPVVGLPGYPVDRARDMALVYIGPHVSLVMCRAVCGIVKTMSGRGVLHFTATRRTMAEIVQKHRESGHYDDPDYDFEGWIERVLPKLKPGWRGAHMYRRRQIWPSVRRWHRDEWKAIPEGLRPYLGTELEPWWSSWWSNWRDR